MLKLLNQANFKRQKSKQEILQDCEKILMSLIISRQIDEKTKEIFAETFNHYKGQVSMIPAFLVKACFLFQDRHYAPFTDYLDCLLQLPIIDYIQERLPAYILKTFETQDKIKVNFKGFEHLNQAIECLNKMFTIDLGIKYSPAKVFMNFINKVQLDESLIMF